MNRTTDNCKTIPIRVIFCLSTASLLTGCSQMTSGLCRSNFVKRSKNENKSVRKSQFHFHISLACIVSLQFSDWMCKFMHYLYIQPCAKILMTIVFFSKGEAYLRISRNITHEQRVRNSKFDQNKSFVLEGSMCRFFMSNIILFYIINKFM